MQVLQIIIVLVLVLVNEGVIIFVLVFILVHEYIQPRTSRQLLQLLLGASVCVCM